MPTFHFEFLVNAPLQMVSEFHRDTRMLKVLTPPPIFVQIHEYQPLAEGSQADFTMWFGPLPVRWKAEHSEVTPHGFTDTQIHGPLKHWRHRHHFTAVGNSATRVDEDIEYEYHTGWRGLLGRLLINRPGLYLLFTARKLILRRQMALMEAQPQLQRSAGQNGPGW